MEGLLRAVEQVREQIGRYRAELQKSEALTRYALIDPILRALGWDTEDPGQVKPEFITKKGRADYALLQDNKPLVVIEAKPLDSDLESAQSQGVNYCVTEGIPYFICTDGQKWELYDVFRSVPLEQKRIFEADLLNEGPGEVARKLLALWRPAAPKVETAPASISVQRPLPPLSGITLSELRKEVTHGRKPPRAVAFPDGSRQDLKCWKDLLAAVGQLVAPRIPKNQVPIYFGPKGILLGLEPVHPTGKKFYAPVQVGKLWLETGIDAPACVRHACRLLEAVGVSPDQVRVEF
ncbi:MAG: type I restriction endonuclease [Candidatus Acetothermia bacterium]|nr:type I restriction endonuclease [Candidatus Acetothermia bacterium]MDH7504625.1 type I restriction endonuclease [Candidatus Acetothermia bacterium]